MAVVLDLDAATRRLDQKLKATEDNLMGIVHGYEDIQQVSKSAINGATFDQAKLVSSALKASDSFDRQVKTVRQLQDHMKRLATAQKNTNNPVLIKKYNDEIVKTSRALGVLRRSGSAGFESINRGARASTVVFNGLKTTIATTFAPLVAVGAITSGISAIISEVTKYEQIAADLQSITGASGDTLEFLKQSAVEVGLETTISAAQTLEAYKLIASAKPELLDNAEGLTAITREAVTLAEAMGGELPEVASNLTDIMNQYQAPASEAAKFTNALAAGSKEGASEVGELAAAFLVAGTNLRASNVPVEQGVALFEALAEQGKKGSEAGTSVRNVLAKLSATDVLPKDAVKRLTAAGVNIEALSDTSLSFADRLRELAPIQNDANALVSLFGLENLSAGQILLGQVDRIDELTAAVTDTNVAYEQAAIRTGTASAEFLKLKNTITALIQGQGGGLSRLVALVIQFARQGVLFLGEVFRQISPVVSGFVNSIGGLFTAFRSLFPATQNAEGGVSGFSRVIQVATVPLRLIIAGLTFFINQLTAVVARARQASQSNTLLGRGLQFLKRAVDFVVNAFLNLPPTLVGAFNAVRVFVNETRAAIGNLAGNIGSVLKEAFSISKLIREGTGDLNAAVDTLLVNPFTGIGDKARQAFKDGFDATKEVLSVPVQAELKAPGGAILPIGDADDGTGGTPTGGGSTLKADEAARKASEKRKKDAEKAAADAAKLAQELARARVDALQDGLDKELALEDLRFNDLKTKLEKFNLDTSQAEIQHEENKLAIKTKFLNEAANLDQLTGEERLKFIFDQTKAEIDALESSLKSINGGALGEDQQKQIALLRKQATDSYLTQLAEFQTKEQKAATDQEIALLELKRSGFASQKEFEEFKEREILNIRLRAAEEQLKIIEALNGAESAAALAIRKTVNEIKGSLEELNSAGANSGFNLYSLFGLDPNDPEGASIIQGIEAAGKALVSTLSDINATRLASAEAAIEEADAQIDATQRLIDAAEDKLDKEESLYEKGLANNKNAVLKDIQLLKQRQAQEKVERDKAFQEKKKIQTQQAILDTITQGNSLLSASAQIFNAVAGIPFVGPVIGAGLVALMIGSFAAAKARIFANINSQKAEKGYVGRVKGRRHTGGGESATDHLEVEDGEAFGILSREATKKHEGVYHDFTNALNKNDKTGMLNVAAKLASDNNVKPGVAKEVKGRVDKLGDINTKLTMNAYGDNTTSEKLLRQVITAVKEQQNGTYYTEQGKIVKRNNFTMRIKKRT